MADIFLEKSLLTASALSADRSEEDKSNSAVCRKMWFGELCIEPVFRTKGGELCCPCTLFVRLRAKSHEGRFFELTDIADAFGDESFECAVFPYIETEERLTACLDALAERLAALLPSMKAVFADDNALKELFDRQEKCFREQYMLKDKHLTFHDESAKEDYLEYLCDLYETTAYLPTMTTDDAYISFLSGDRAKAERLIKKKKRPLDFERRLLAAMYELPPDFKPISDECFARSDYKSALRGKILATFLLMLPVFTAVYCGAYVQLCRLLSKGCLMSLEMPWYDGILLFAAAPALMTAVTHYDHISALFTSRASRKRLTEFTDITISQKFRTSLNILLTIVLAFSAFEMMMLSSIAVRFYGGKVTEPATEIPMPWDNVIAYKYEDVTGIYRYDGQTNDYDEYISRPGYVITFKGGYSLDLDGYGDIDTQASAVALLNEYCDTVTSVYDRADIVTPSKLAPLK